MRLFYAALLEQKDRKKIHTLTGGILSALIKKGRFIPEENYHLTLHFLGETNPEELPELTELLSDLICRIKEQEIVFSRIGTFPRRGEHLVYLKPESEYPDLKMAVDLIRKELGSRERKPFQPHITLARRVLISSENLKMLKSQTVHLPPVKIRHLALMESVFTDRGVVYRPVRTGNLSKNP